MKWMIRMVASSLVLALAVPSANSEVPDCEGCVPTATTTTVTTTFPDETTLTVEVTSREGGCDAEAAGGVFYCEATACEFDITWSWSGFPEGEKVAGCWGRYRPDDPDLRERNCEVDGEETDASGSGSESSTVGEEQGVQCNPLPYYFGLEVGSHSIEATSDCSACAG